MKAVFCMVLSLCLHFSAFAQAASPISRGLQPGDRLPDITLESIHNYPAKQARLSELQQELTIIDFWATWCGSCIESFTKLDALQQKFEGRVKLLMVNGYAADDEKKVAAFLKRRKERTGLSFSLTYLLQDSILHHYFPHKTIPHCVWLDKQRKVIAITESYAVTEDNIAAVLSGKPVQLEFKNDALLLDEKIGGLDMEGSNAELLQGSQITSEQKGRGNSIGYEAGENGLYKKMRVLNYPLFNMYQVSNPELFKYGILRVRIDSNIAHLFEGGNESAGKKYCYQLESNGMTKQEMMKQMSADLEQYFKVKVVAEERNEACYTLSQESNMQALASKGGDTGSDLREESIRNYIHNEKPTRLCSYLQSILKKPVIDETGFTNTIDIEFPTGFRQYNARQVMDFLKAKGIVLQQAKRMLWITRLKAINNNY